MYKVNRLARARSQAGRDLQQDQRLPRDGRRRDLSAAGRTRALSVLGGGERARRLGRRGRGAEAAGAAAPTGPRGAQLDQAGARAAQVAAGQAAAAAAVGRRGSALRRHQRVRVLAHQVREFVVLAASVARRRRAQDDATAASHTLDEHRRSARPEAARQARPGRDRGQSGLSRRAAQALHDPRRSAPAAGLARHHSAHRPFRLDRVVVLFRNVLRRSNVERLLCSVSVYVVRVCVNSVDAKLIVDQPLDSAKSIEACLACCRDYRVVYDNIISGCIENESREWKVDKAVVFNCVEAFEQRCEDLLDICQTIVIYGSLNKINLGGTRGRRHEAQYNHIREYFMRVVEETRQACANCALDVRRTDWFPVAVSFRARIADLEKTMRTLLLGLFGDDDDNDDNVATTSEGEVESAIETLYALQRFRDRKTFRCLLHDKWTQVWAMFDREIAMPPVDVANSYDEIPADRFRLPREDELRDPEIIRRNYLKRLHKMMIDTSDWLGDCDAQHEVLAKYSATV
ncbi:unnamed protein product [Trichogramma brassicae]|uniref:Dynein heavy chain tail domain-containing protein n=1 Tax=Trichogramma brassicae TaxID=86971 RepID=A0A6H5J4N6_9HYME|nr:unnamed protein product [Trichogramma brassicae]